jgi:catechol 2,3-dioxygenase-like lactoylglutathione lyase family enzyme
LCGPASGGKFSASPNGATWLREDHQQTSYESTMTRYVHSGLGSVSLENTDLFYGRLLGLERTEPKTLPRETVAALFGVETDLTMVYYQNETSQFELFVHPDLKCFNGARGNVSHDCIQVEGKDGFVEQCEKSGCEVLQVSKGDKVLTFVKDLDGNLFELK